ncbi:MAG TPA: FAD-dependent oxidoreductase [Xanthobacteraceae bacterium]|nr:FAD-dependent oxidoreductase [Xanthobacteraceae bacterium]
MARSDVIVLGAGIVGTSAALQLARRGLAVVLVDRRGPGEETSYGNAGVIGGAGVYPTPFPRRFGKLLEVALKRAPEANFHWTALPALAPWLLAYFRASAPRRLEATGRALRPLMARSVGEHERLAAEAGALNLIRKDGWISLYRSARGFADLAPQLELGAALGVRATPLDPDGATALEPSLAPVFRHAVHWPDIASVSNPLALTRAYAARFSALGGVLIKGDARSLHRNGRNWRVDTAEGPVDAPQAVIALGPWSPDVLGSLGIRLPFAVKRGYHRHYRARGNASLKRPVVDSEVGYVLAPMEQGTRLTTGAEFARRDAPASPVQFGRVLPYARQLFPLGEAIEDVPWMGARPCLPDMRPVLGAAPGQPGLWLDTAHNHFGLTLGPVSGRLIADLVTGAIPFCDPAPFAAERFG